MPRIDPHSAADLARNPQTAAAVCGAELAVPRLRDVSHAVAFGVAVIAAVVIIVVAPPGWPTVAARGHQ